MMNLLERVLRMPRVVVTVMVLLLIAGSIFFLAGVRAWKFGVVIASVLGTMPVAWSLLRDRDRETGAGVTGSG